NRHLRSAHGKWRTQRSTQSEHREYGQGDPRCATRCADRFALRCRLRHTRSSWNGIWLYVAALAQSLAGGIVFLCPFGFYSWLPIPGTARSSRDRAFLLGPVRPHLARPFLLSHAESHDGADSFLGICRRNHVVDTPVANPPAQCV